MEIKPILIPHVKKETVTVEDLMVGDLFSHQSIWRISKWREVAL